jgi:hypothetical protein
MFLNGRPDGIVKRMTMAVYGIPCHPDSEVMPIITFEQINPPKRYTMLGNRFARIHRATMVLRDGTWRPIDGVNGKRTKADLLATAKGKPKRARP